MTVNCSHPSHSSVPSLHSGVGITPLSLQCWCHSGVTLVLPHSSSVPPHSSLLLTPHSSSFLLSPSPHSSSFLLNPPPHSSLLLLNLFMFLNDSLIHGFIKKTFFCNMLFDQWQSWKVVIAVSIVRKNSTGMII